MERALKIIDQLHLVAIVCVFDQTIYSKACEIKMERGGKISKLCTDVGDLPSFNDVYGNFK